MLKYLSFIVLLVLFSSSVLGLYVDAGSGEIVFDDVLIYGYSEKTITVAHDGGEAVQVSLSATDPIVQWLTFVPSTAFVSKGLPAEFTVILQPDGAELGDYDGFIILSSHSDSSAVSSVLDLKTKVRITDHEISQASVEDVVLDDVLLSEPVKSFVTVVNDGNLPVSSYFTLVLSGEDEADVLGTYQSAVLDLKPSARGVLEWVGPSDLLPGEYRADISVFAGDMLLCEHLIPFQVLEQFHDDTEIYVADTVALSTNWIVLVVWGLLLLFVVWKIADKK